MEVGDEPRRKKIEPMSMRGATVDAEDSRLTGCAIVKIVQPCCTSFDHVTCVGSWLETAFGTVNTLVHIVPTKIC